MKKPLRSNGSRALSRLMLTTTLALLGLGCTPAASPAGGCCKKGPPCLRAHGGGHAHGHPHGAGHDRGEGHAHGHPHGAGHGDGEGHAHGGGHGDRHEHRPAQAEGHAHGMPHRFEDAEAWSKRFDAAERDAWQKPDEVIHALALPTDAMVVDLGAGTGYFAVRLARALPKGRVLALDVEPNMVRFMTDRATRDGLPNLVARETPKDRAALDGAADLVLVVDTYHHLAARPAYVRALRSSLSPRGRVAIVDFRLESERGPPKEHRLAPERVIEELGEAGFALSARYELLPDQYFLVFSPR